MNELNKLIPGSEKNQGATLQRAEDDTSGISLERSRHPARERPTSTYPGTHSGPVYYTR
ncbi:hypothetical protein NHJ13051_008534 [Beauveria bassiana]